jgi:ArsR family transcriptional regulator
MQASAIRRVRGRVAVLKALAHPVRVQLVELLSRGERCVCELHEAAGGDFSTVSKHLAQLRQAGLLDMEKRGLKVFYRLRNRCVLRLLACADEAARTAAKEVRR